MVIGEKREEEGRTDDCLRVFGARGPEAELAELGLGFVREGVETGFGRLG